MSNIPDIQGRPDTRNLPIQRVGIKDYRHPITVIDAEQTQQTVATTSVYVNLPAETKGTHMSRFIEQINEIEALDTATLTAKLDGVCARLQSSDAFIETSFTYFVNKSAPVSQRKSYMDYEVRYYASKEKRITEVWRELLVPVTSLCPCSKEISKYGAHNQRSHIIVLLLEAEPASLASHIRMIEQQGSCELYGTLKREDEKFITERAYENPKFVEDIVRDVALHLNQDENVLAYRVSSENFESIHNHAAYAEIESDKRTSINE